MFRGFWVTLSNDKSDPRQHLRIDQRQYESGLERSTSMFPRLSSMLLLIAALIGFGVVLSEQELFGDIFTDSSRNLARNSESYGKHKCLKQVPTVLYRTEKDEELNGNGTNRFFYEIDDCCDGYKRTKYDWNRCEPDCGTKCKNGFCRAPGRCECFDGFRENERGECVFACPLGCENGRCYLNGTCRCNPGFVLSPSKTFCRPVCNTACGKNQMCVGPNKCDCKVGFQMTAIGCQPICTPDCGHGRCVAPNQCECFDKFAMRPPRTVCEAECFMYCDNGFCESQYQCLCYDGYKFDVNTTMCLPDCGDRCENGNCIKPGICQCFEGYELKDNTCIPVCQYGCGYYGKCIAPNVCGCAFTNQQCMFGNCDAAGRCICSQGLAHFIDRCVSPNHLQTLVSSSDQRQFYNQQLKVEFHNLIGKHFVDIYAF